MEITIEQLIQYHEYFSIVVNQTDKTMEIVTKLEDRLHAILTTLAPAPTKES